MKNELQEEINQIIKKLLKNVRPNEKPPIILTPKDLDMIIDYTYYSLKLNINLKRLKNSFNQSHMKNQARKKSTASTPSETQNTIIEVKSLKEDITDNDLDNYIKQAEKYILTINRKTMDSLEKEEKLDINELLSQLPSISKTHTLKNSNILFSSVNENKQYVMPFDFISHYEIDNYTNNTNLLKQKKYFILSDHRNSEIIRYNPMEYITREKLFRQIYKRNSQITCIDVKNGILFLGNNLGIIKTYSIEKEYEYKTYESNELNNLNDINKSVTSLCSSPDNETFISGHHNGAIILWETYSTKIKKFIAPSKNINCKIIQVRYLVKLNGYYTIITSDIEGKVKLITILEGYFMTSVCVQDFINKPKPCYLIECLSFDKEEKKLYDIELDKMTNYIALIGNEESVEVFILSVDSSIISGYTTGNIEYKIQNVLVISNPLSNFGLKKEEFINFPNACFGYGYISNIKEKEVKNKITNKLDDDSDSEKEEDETENKLDKIKGDILLGICWNNKISVYSINIINNELQKPEYAGYYIDENANIIHMGFFSSSIIFYIDEKKNIKLLNTNLIKKEENKNIEKNKNKLNENKEENTNDASSVNSDIKLNRKISSSEINNNKELNNYKEITIKDSNLMYTFNHEKNIKIFNNYISSNPKNIYILSRNIFNHIKLYSWEQCLYNMKSNFDWITMFCIGIDIYKGHANIKSLADIPNETYYRKTKVKYVLKKIIKEYFTINLNDNLGPHSNYDFVNITIETCINIEDLDFLLDEIYHLIDTKGFGDLFLERIEPFILKDKIKNQILAPTTLNLLIEFYTNKNKIYNLSQLLLHLNLKCLNCELIKKISLQYDYYSTIIYIYTNGLNDYFYPLVLMYGKFTSLLNKNKDDEKTFIDIINDDSNKIPNKYETLEKTNEYLGYKIFWYINICIKGQKYPTFNELIDEHSYFDLIIVFFIFYSNAANLRLFDSFTYFLILENFFTDKNILSIIKQINKKLIVNIQKRKNIQLFNKEDNVDLDLQSILINGIYKIQNNSFFDKYDLSFFIIKICTKFEIKENILYDSIFFLLSYYKSISSNYNTLKSKDNFGIHSKILDFDDEYLKIFNKYVISSIDVLKSYYSDRNLFKKRYINNLINIVNESPFTLIKIYLFDLNNEYNKCIDLYLENNSLSYEEKFQIFGYINNKLEELQSNPYFLGDNPNPEKNYYEDFKNYISNKIEKLAEISIEELEKLILNWYKKEQISIIHKLDIVPEIQIQYLHFFTKEVINNYINEHGDINGGGITDEMRNIFFLYFELLIKMDKSDYLVSALKENIHFYPLEKCLDLALKNNLNEITIYIYELLGKYNMALSVSLNEIENIYTKTKNIIVNEDDFEIKIDNRNNLKDIKEDLFFRLQRSINKAIKICQKVSGNLEKSSTGNIHLQLWYNLFRKLFEIYEDLKLSNQNNSLEEISLVLLLTNELENFLKNSFAYQGSEKIIYYVINIIENKEEYQDFMNILTKILPSLKNYTSMLKSGAIMYKNCAMNDIEIFKEKTFEGVDLKIHKCKKCKKNFDKLNKKKIIAFQCGHMLHLGCCFVYQETPYCSVCYDDKYEYQLTFPKNIVSEKIDDLPNQQQIDALKRRKKMHLLTKLDILDNNYFEEGI